LKEGTYSEVHIFEVGRGGKSVQGRTRRELERLDLGDDRALFVDGPCFSARRDKIKAIEHAMFPSFGDEVVRDWLRSARSNGIDQGHRKVGFDGVRAECPGSILRRRPARSVDNTRLALMEFQKVR
jgi:hypothetical protein